MTKQEKAIKELVNHIAKDNFNQANEALKTITEQKVAEKIKKAQDKVKIFDK